MKRILFVIVLVAAALYWQRDTITEWWNRWQADRVAEDLSGDELAPEVDSLDAELDAAINASAAELDAIEAEQ